MIPAAMSRPIRQVADQFMVEVALSPARIGECYQLRCVSRDADWSSVAGYDGPAHDRQAHDAPGHAEFDQRAHHVALISRQTGAIMGTARLVPPPRLDRPGDSFPLQRVCTVALPADMPIRTTADVSCCALSHDRSFDIAPLMRLGLFQGLIRVSDEIGLTHWCAVMEPTLLRLLGMTGIRFNPIGPLIDCGDVGQPCYNSISAILWGMKRERPPVWEYLTDGGLLWREPAGPSPSGQVRCNPQCASQSPAGTGAV